MMRGNLTRVGALAGCWCLVAAVAVAQEQTQVSSDKYSVAQLEASGAISTDTLKEVPANEPVRHVHVSQDGQRVITDGGVAGGTVTVYSNTQGGTYAPGLADPDTVWADDIVTTSAFGCDGFELTILTFAGGEDLPAYSVNEVLIWSDCPGAAGAAVLFDLTGGVPVDLPDGGAFEITFDLTGITVPPNFWVSVTFDTTDAGWVFDQPAEIGFSDDIFYIPEPPGFGCNTFWGGYPEFAHASYYVVVTCSGDVDTQFKAFESNTFSGFLYGSDGCSGDGLDNCGGGSGVDLDDDCVVEGDDATLVVDECQLSQIDVQFAGLAGAYDAEWELWTSDDNGTPDEPLDDIPGAPIPGTASDCFTGVGDAFLEEFTQSYDGTATLPQKVWLVWQDNSADAGPIIAGSLPQVGDSEDAFAIYAIDTPGEWSPGFFFGGCDTGACGSFNMSIWCVGVEPTGACCNDAEGTCTDGLGASNCANLGGRFLADTLCADNLFDPPCGTAACCDTGGGCTNEDPGTCSAGGSAPIQGSFCEDAGFSCPVAACIGAEGNCLEANGSPGCNDAECCDIVCLIDPFCCDFEWDSTCANTAANQEECVGAICGDGTCNGDETCGTCPEDCCPNCGDAGAGDCCVANGTIGCDDLECCTSVCDADAFCCDTEWDQICADAAAADPNCDCGGGCPEANIVSADPMGGTVDARQPINLAGDTLQGIGSASEPIELTFDAPPSGDAACYAVCDTGANTNGVASVTVDGNTASIVLNQRIELNAVTTVTYTGATGGATPEFISHPANTNGDSVAGVSDVLNVVDMLNGVTAPVHGNYSQDIDHSCTDPALPDGCGFTGADILRTIDLLNGAPPFPNQNLTSLPTNGGICP